MKLGGSGWSLVACAAALHACTAKGDGPAPFTEEAISRGVTYTVQPYGTSQANGFGVAIADLTGNGHQDLLLMGASSGLIGLFENDGDGFFTNRSFTDSGAPRIVLQRPTGVAVADYNADGLLDVYITQEMKQSTGQLFPNVLLRNDGQFQLPNVAVAAGVNNLGNSQGAAWADYDNDGLLDLYVANYLFPQYAANSAHWNKLFRNLGSGAFQDVAVGLGVADLGMTFTPAFTDMNRDGWLDLYIVNDRGHLPSLVPNQLWRNEDGSFVKLCDEPSDSGACIGLWAMGVGVGDVTCNGYPDFYVTNIAHPAGYNGWNAFLINQGDETFVEHCPEAGVCSLATSWASIFFDFDNDGMLDIYVCNQVHPNRLYQNLGDGTFIDVADAVAAVGSNGWSYNAAVGDVNGDGAIDILLNNYGLAGGPAANVQLFINHEGASRKWIRFEVAGLPGSSNLNAIGANIEITAAGKTQWREIYAGGNNYKAQNELIFHFGLGEATAVDQVVVNWPGGQAHRTLINYSANHQWTIYPPQVLGDSDNDGYIGVPDLIALLSGWGELIPGHEIMDVNGDGQISVPDLIELLAKWGN